MKVGKLTRHRHAQQQADERIGFDDKDVVIAASGSSGEHWPTTPAPLSDAALTVAQS